MKRVCRVTRLGIHASCHAAALAAHFKDEGWQEVVALLDYAVASRKRLAGGGGGRVVVMVGGPVTVMVVAQTPVFPAAFEASMVMGNDPMDGGVPLI